MARVDGIVLMHFCRYCQSRVLANTVYCDLIADKQHVHMNATVWSTLSEFVLYLKRSGKCNVDWSEEGWYLEYIDHDRLEKEEREEAKRREELSAEQRREKIMNRLVEEAWKDTETQQKEVVPFDRSKTENVSFAMPANPTKPEKEEPTAPAPLDLTRLAGTAQSETQISNAQPDTEGSTLLEPPRKKKLTALERIVAEQEERKRGASSRGLGASSSRGGEQSDMRRQPEREDQRREVSRSPPAVRARPFARSSPPSDGAVESGPSRVPPQPPPVPKPRATSEAKEVPQDEDEEPWLGAGLVVRVMNASLGNGKYYRQKGKVLKTRDDGYVGEVQMLQRGDVLLLDQATLHPVVPTVNAEIMVIRGKQKGTHGTILSVDLDTSEAHVDFRDRIVALPFDDICKYTPAADSSL